jgi:hypothetical protein
MTESELKIHLHTVKENNKCLLKENIRLLKENSILEEEKAKAYVIINREISIKNDMAELCVKLENFIVNILKSNKAIVNL